MKTNTMRFGWVLGMAIVLAGVTAHAAMISTALNGGSGTFAVSATDLANSDQSTFSSITIDDTANRLFSSNESKLVDGDVYGGGLPGTTSASLAPAAGTVVVIYLDTTANIHGYDISSIVSLTGNASSRTGQDYDITVRTVGSGVFTPLWSVGGETNNVDSGVVEVQVTIADSLGDVLATGVDALQFTFAATNDSADVYREIDIFGTATIIPEPASAFLLALAGGVCLRRRKRE